MSISRRTSAPSSSLPGGVWPVMLTPFLDDGRIDWAGADALTDWYLNAGVAGLFAVCLSSDMYYLTDDQRLELAAHVVRHVKGRVPIVATGTFGGPIRAQAGFMERMAATGVAAVVVVVNQLVTVRESATVWQQHMLELLRLTHDIPLGLYECPVPYHRLLAPELLGWAAATGRFLFMKDTCCRLGEIRAKLAAIRGTPVCWYNAHAATLLASMRAGGRGYSGIAANFYPELFVWLCAQGRDHAQNAEALQRKLTLWDMALRPKYWALACEFLRRRGLALTSVAREPGPALEEEDLLLLDSLLAEVNAAITALSCLTATGSAFGARPRQVRKVVP